MKVKYNEHSIYWGLVDFPFKEGDYVTIVEQYWRNQDSEDNDYPDIYYHGHITEFEEEREGFWAVLDDDTERAEFFHYGDLEAVLPGDRIPFLGGSTMRKKERAE
jgi:hypothetical protein